MDILSKRETILAIDPGLSGAVARIGRGEITVRRDFKTITEIAAAVKELALSGIDSAVIELVGARPGQGVCSMFSFGKSTGAAYGALAFLGIKPVEVAPLRWQNYFRAAFALDRKHHPDFDSRALALRLLPNYADLFKRKKDHNTADAVLLGLWKLAQD